MGYDFELMTRYVPIFQVKKDVEYDIEVLKELQDKMLKTFENIGFDIYKEIYHNNEIISYGRSSIMSKFLVKKLKILQNIYELELPFNVIEEAISLFKNVLDFNDFTLLYEFTNYYKIEDMSKEEIDDLTKDIYRTIGELKEIVYMKEKYPLMELYYRHI